MFERRDGGQAVRALVTCSDHATHMIAAAGGMCGRWDVIFCFSRCTWDLVIYNAMDVKVIVRLTTVTSPLTLSALFTRSQYDSVTLTEAQLLPQLHLQHL